MAELAFRQRVARRQNGDKNLTEFEEKYPGGPSSNRVTNHLENKYKEGPPTGPSRRGGSKTKRCLRQQKG